MNRYGPVLAALWVATACGADGPPRCTPGASVACACPEGTSGAQVCGADGTFGPCECVIAVPSAAAPEVLAPPPPPPGAAPGGIGCVDPATDAARRAAEEAGGEPYDPLAATTERVDADGDGVPELAVAFGDFCGNAPSCLHWLYAPADGDCPVFVRTWDRPMF